MSAAIPNGRLTIIGAGRGKLVPANVGGLSLGVSRWPTDPIGTFALELTNVVIGSRIHIETQGDGTTLHDSVADATSETISLSAYASGSAYNALRVKVRKGSAAQKYLPFETLATAVVGSQSVFVSQVPDTIAS